MFDATPNPFYVAARRVLLDATDALGAHRHAVVLVGAQAVYLRAGEADLELSVAPFTADADLGIDTTRLGSDPRIAEAMLGAGFRLKIKAAGGVEPGTWLAVTEVGGSEITVPVDLLVPEAMAPLRGRRDARLPAHGKNATRWTPGLEATVFDNTEMVIGSLEPESDPRQASIRVAGPASLLVAKCHKVADRLADGRTGRTHRVKPKDCGDVIRLMRCPISPMDVGKRLAELSREPQCAASVVTGVGHLCHQFGGPTSPGVELALEAMAAAMSADLIRGLAVGYVEALMLAYES